jgi:AcrR family transcriptional regulator
MTRIVKRPDERRKEIIRAARELFQEKDYDKMTMRDLMKKLNIAKGTIYHYFSSKEDLLESVVEDLIYEELKRKKKLLKSRQCINLNALDKFRMLVTTDTMANDNKQILENLHHPGNTLMHTRLLGLYILKLAPIFATVIEEGCNQGVFKTEHPRECAEFLFSGFQFLTDLGFYPWSQRQLTRRVRAFPSLIETQLGAPKGSFSFLAE